MLLARRIDRSVDPRASLRDKALSPFISQRIALELERSFALGASQTLRSVAAIDPSLYLYDDFPPFRRLAAIDVTWSVVLEL